MLDFLFTVCIGIAIGWLLPQPPWFRVLVDKAWGWFKAKFFTS